MSGKPSERLCRRAAKLWRTLCENPAFDNGDNSPNGAISQLLVRSIKTNADSKRFDKFEEILAEKIMKPTRGSYVLYLSVDYDPDPILAEAAKDAGLDIQFPWKTTIIIEPHCVSVRAGYSSPYVNHYPLPDGKWLIASLSGADMGKIINHVLTGEPLGLPVSD